MTYQNPRDSNDPLGTRRSSAFSSWVPLAVAAAVALAVIAMMYPRTTTDRTGDTTNTGPSVQTDQEIAGLIMWVGMNTLFLVMLSVIFLKWAGREERADYESLREESREKRRLAREAAAEASGAQPAHHQP